MKDNISLLRAIRNMKASGKMDVSKLLSDDNEMQDKEESKEESKEDKKQGLAPKVTQENQVNSDDESKGKGLARQALEMLGRNPMSIAKSKSSSAVADSLNAESIGGVSVPDASKMDPEVMEMMSDKNVQENLRDGRRLPKSLRDKVQLNIMKMIKKK